MYKYRVSVHTTDGGLENGWIESYSASKYTVMTDIVKEADVRRGIVMEDMTGRGLLFVKKDAIRSILLKPIKEENA